MSEHPGLSVCPACGGKLEVVLDDGRIVTCPQCEGYGTAGGRDDHADLVRRHNRRRTGRQSTRDGLDGKGNGKRAEIPVFTGGFALDGYPDGYLGRD